MRELMSLAEGLGIVLNIEVLNRFEQFLINTSVDVLLSYVQKVCSSSIWILLDIFHMNIEEVFFVDAIRNSGRLLGWERISWEEIKQAFDDIPIK